MGHGVGAESALIPRELRLRTVLAVILVLKGAIFASFLAGWLAGPFEEQHSAYLYVSQGHRYKQTQKIKSSPLERMALFDGQWYREIASEGYTFETTYQGGWSSYAFFPAFPALCALAGSTGLGVLAGGLLLNQVLSIASGLLLFLVARQVVPTARDDAAPLLAVMCFYLYPTAGFLNVLYSESLFVFLVLSHILLFERGSVRGSVVAGILVGLCRPQGVLLVFWHLGRLASGSGFSRRDLIAGSSPVVGFLLFWGYTSWQTGSPTSLFELQTTWGRHGDVGNILHDLAESVHSFSGWMMLVSLLVAASTLVLTRRVTGSLSWTMLSLSMIAVPLATGSTTSMARFLLANVPQYIVLGTVLRNRPVLQIVVLCSLGALQGMANVQMVNWKWVA